MALDYASRTCSAGPFSFHGLACADQALGALPPQQRAEFKADLTVRIAARVTTAAGAKECSSWTWPRDCPSPRRRARCCCCRRSRFPAPRAQYSVRDLDDREIWRLDFAWPDARVAVEYDGYAAHVNKAEADQGRDEDLRRRGSKVLRADVSDLRNPVRLFRELSVALSGPERSVRALRT